jgi:hypothetical protein
MTKPITHEEAGEALLRCRYFEVRLYIAQQRAREAAYKAVIAKLEAEGENLRARLGKENDNG